MARDYCIWKDMCVKDNSKDSKDKDSQIYRRSMRCKGDIDCPSYLSVTEINEREKEKSLLESITSNSNL